VDRILSRMPVTRGPLVPPSTPGNPESQNAQTAGKDSDITGMAEMIKAESEIVATETSTSTASRFFATAARAVSTMTRIFEDRLTELKTDVTRFCSSHLNNRPSQRRTHTSSRRSECTLADPESLRDTIEPRQEVDPLYEDTTRCLTHNTYTYVSSTFYATLATNPSTLSISIGDRIKDLPSDASARVNSDHSEDPKRTEKLFEDQQRTIDLSALAQLLTAQMRVQHVSSMDELKLCPNLEDLRATGQRITNERFSYMNLDDVLSPHSPGLRAISRNPPPEDSEDSDLEDDKQGSEQKRLDFDVQEAALNGFELFDLDYTEDDGPLQSPTLETVASADSSGVPFSDESDDYALLREMLPPEIELPQDEVERAQERAKQHGEQERALRTKLYSAVNRSESDRLWDSSLRQKPTTVSSASSVHEPPESQLANITASIARDLRTYVQPPRLPRRKIRRLPRRERQQRTRRRAATADLVPDFHSPTEPTIKPAMKTKPVKSTNAIEIQGEFGDANRLIEPISIVSLFGYQLQPHILPFPRPKGWNILGQTEKQTFFIPTALPFANNAMSKVTRMTEDAFTRQIASLSELPRLQRRASQMGSFGGGDDEGGDFGYGAGLPFAGDTDNVINAICQAENAEIIDIHTLAPSRPQREAISVVRTEIQDIDVEEKSNRRVVNVHKLKRDITSTLKDAQHTSTLVVTKNPVARETLETTRKSRTVDPHDYEVAAKALEQHVPAEVKLDAQLGGEVGQVRYTSFSHLVQQVSHNAATHKGTPIVHPNDVAMTFLGLLLTANSENFELRPVRTDGEHLGDFLILAPQHQQQQ